MVAIITGDIINSRKANAKLWQPKLKAYFSQSIAEAKKWEIYRGDSFQIEVEVENALDIAMSIKALIRSISTLNVRMAIGIGEKNFAGKKVIESNGTAFVNSGEGFDNLKNTTFSIKTPFEEIDIYFVPILKLISFITDGWKPVTAETIFNALNHKSMLQKDLAQKLGKDRTTISKALKRGGYEEITDILNLYRKKITLCTSSS